MSERVHLPVVPSQAAPEVAAPETSTPDGAPRRPRHPPWIKAQLPTKPAFFEMKELVRAQKLHTVCESASCPNIGECWTRRALTIMILGDICTRSCRFCDVVTGRPLPPDPDEPRRVADTLAQLGLEHTVITCVDRDDLPDFGAAHWAETITRVKAACPAMTLEVLVGDFKGRTEHADIVLAAEPDVFAHNLETVPRLSRQVRVQASYPRSYQILEHARRRGAITKTGLMLGLGEELAEVEEVLRELAGLGVEIVTLGQYLSPSRQHLPIARYLHPDEFAQLRVFALAAGISHVESGPLVRSSYHADGQAAMIRALRADRR
ncbi:MAG: lipoyl synthase [Kofleriaceae bacterium]|jgi:lipoic acid synthetase|nr:lipoyl synthase [Kofleriaceae bacterium]MBP6838554.1 lipoyl synthase [Kofleriaceae bacterium]MBP9207973.1 lipoyl synthase [Kofleriaceae bacterium]